MLIHSEKWKLKENKDFSTADSPTVTNVNKHPTSALKLDGWLTDGTFKKVYKKGMILNILQ